MRSFTSVLIVAALVTFIGAAPLGPANPPGLPPPPAVAKVVGHVGSVVGGVHARAVPGIVSDVQSEVARLSGRDQKLSVPIVIDIVTKEIDPHVQELKDCTSANADAAKIGGIVALIQHTVDAAIPQIKALQGRAQNEVLVTVDGQVMTAKQVAYILSGLLHRILIAVEYLLAWVPVDVQAVIKAAIGDVFLLVADVVCLVDGLDDILGPLLVDVGDIIAQLGLEITWYHL